MWVPPEISEKLIGQHIMQSLLHPELYNDEAAVPMTPCWLVMGQEGQHKADAIIHELQSQHDKVPTFALVQISVPDDYGDPSDTDCITKQRRNCETILSIIAQQRSVIDANNGALSSNTGAVLVVEHADRLARSSSFSSFFESLPSRMHGLHIQCILCCDVPTHRLGRDIQHVYRNQRQIFFSTPDLAWRHRHFVQRFEVYKKFIANNIMSKYVDVDMTDEDCNFLAQCAAHETQDTIYQFCANIFHAVHKTTLVHKGEHGAREDDKGNIRRVIDLTYCKRYLKDRGGALFISNDDAYEREQQFAMACGAHMPAPENRTKATITDATLYENGGVPPAKQQDRDVLKYTEKVEDDEQDEISSPIVTKKRQREGVDIPE